MSKQKPTALYTIAKNFSVHVLRCKTGESALVLVDDAGLVRAFATFEKKGAAIDAAKFLVDCSVEIFDDLNKKKYQQFDDLIAEIAKSADDEIAV